jgi:hypothetical protein
VLPDWFDLDMLRAFVAGATVVTALGAIFAIAFFRTVSMRAGLAVVLLGITGALLVYAQGPLEDCEKTCDCRFLKSDLAVSGCAPPAAAGRDASN